MNRENNYIKPVWPAPSSIKAYTTTRTTPGIINQDKKVDYESLKTFLKLPTLPIKIRQTHGDIILPALPQNQNKEADAIWTDQPNQVCAIVTADCLPVLLTHRQGTHVAAIHAGWRGLAKEIIPKTVQRLNLPGEDIIAWLGPGISQSCYEVTDEMRDEFLSSDPKTASAFIPSVNQRWLLDLYAIARLQLKKQGVTEIYGGEYCTFCDSKNFFSYRREGSNHGQMATLIWISYNS
ncbi:MAG: yfiH [Gammaproteobacteria bacterium]|jgi:YfiH family protein|nr:yfiH [Gammaproteobacteria bacterium]